MSMTCKSAINLFVCSVAMAEVFLFWGGVGEIAEPQCIASKNVPLVTSQVSPVPWNWSNMKSDHFESFGNVCVLFSVTFRFDYTDISIILKHRRSKADPFSTNDFHWRIAPTTRHSYDVVGARGNALKFPMDISIVKKTYFSRYFGNSAWVWLRADISKRRFIE